MNKKVKRNKWISGAARDWIVPLKHNLWVQIALGEMVFGFLCLLFYFVTGNFNVLALFILAISIGMITLGSTEFGKGTVNSYRRVKKVIQRHGRVDQQFQEKVGERLYCYRVGAKVALIKYAPSNAITKSLAKTWIMLKV